LPPSPLTSTTSTAPGKKDTKPCPKCGEEIPATARKCQHCGEFFDETPPAKQSPGDIAVPPSICGACGWAGVEERKLYRLGVPGAIIGCLLLILSVIGILLGILGLFAPGLTMPKVVAGLGAFSGKSAIGAIAASFVGGLIGWSLTRKTTVFQCAQCSAVAAAS
jgi:predicted RNA-binding Zn-ribbon protein involved in translation (DUF1610 family)